MDKAAMSYRGTREKKYHVNSSFKLLDKVQQTVKVKIIILGYNKRLKL